MIGESIFKCLRKKFQYYVSSCISAVIMIFFYILSGGGVSTKRAVIMFIISLVARTLGVRYDMRSSLSFAVLIILFSNPYYLYNVSFILSVTAIAAIAYIYPEIEKLLGKRKSNRLLKSFFLSLSVWVATIPILARTYFEISVCSVFVNVLVIPLMTVVLVMGLISVGVSICFTDFGRFFMGIDIYILKLYELICDLAEKLPAHSISVAKISGTDTFIYYAVIGLVMIILHLADRGKKTKILKKPGKAAGICVIITGMGILMLISIILKKNETLITFIDVGQGDCTFLNVSGTTVIIDGGSSDVKNVGKNRIVPTIRSYGYNYVDVIFISHTDNDHISGIVEIVEKRLLEIGCVYVPDIQEEGMESFLMLLEKNNIAYKKIKAGKHIKAEAVYFEALSPYEEMQGDINDKSLVLYCKIKGVKCIFTGDISSEVEKELLKRYYKIMENVNVLKVAHHGSKTGSCSEFMEVLRPDIAVISCGVNNIYKHPHKETINTLSDYGIYYEITGDKGAVFVNIRNKKLLTDTYL